MLQYLTYQRQRAYFVKRLQVATCDDRDWHNVVPSNIIISLRRGSYYRTRFTNARRTSSLGSFTVVVSLEIPSEKLAPYLGEKNNWKTLWHPRWTQRTMTHTVQPRHYFIHSTYMQCRYHSDICSSREVMKWHARTNQPGREKIFTLYFSSFGERNVADEMPLLIMGDKPYNLNIESNLKLTPSFLSSLLSGGVMLRFSMLRFYVQIWMESLIAARKTIEPLYSWISKLR